MFLLYLIRIRIRKVLDMLGSEMRKRLKELLIDFLDKDLIIRILDANMQI
jgi:hypothetical protein